MKYENADLFEDPSRDPYNSYVFLRDLKLLDCVEVDYEKDKVNVDLSKLYSGERDGKEIDIAETISNLRGKWIKRIEEEKVVFEDGEAVNTKDVDFQTIKQLIWWEQLAKG